MLQRTYLTQLLLPRIAEASNRLRAQSWQPAGGPYPVSQSKPTAEHLNFREAEDKPFKKIDQFPHVWGKLFDQCWWQLPRELVSDAKNSPSTLYLDWRDDAEATLYADGVPWHGIDPGHEYIPLPNGASNLRIESACVRSGVWVPGNKRNLSDEGSVFHGAYTYTRNDDAWLAWITIDLLREYIDHVIHKQMPEHLASGGSAGYRPALDRLDPLVRRLIDRIDKSLDLLDTNGPAACYRQLRKHLGEFTRNNAHPLSCVLTGHAHIDLVWLWPERVGEFKAVHTFSTMTRLMEKYPEFRFAYSQPASYEAVARRSPQLLKKVMSHIDSGTWEAEGGSYVEADTQLPCGENLARAFLLGQEGFQALSGKPSSILWLPDVFGYSGCLPQIMSQTGVSRFFTTKLTWCSVSRFPHSSFRWRGFDGSEVLVHVTQAYGYNGCVSIKEIDDGQLHYQQAGVHDSYLAPIGWGDGGGGPTDVMCERARILKDFSGTPETKWGKVDEFFNQLEEVRDELPVFQGELYMEYHRGVQTTHGDLKSAFRAAERGLQTLEAIHCAKGAGSIDKHSWKRLVLAQFHDYIPGSSVREVYQEAIPELLEIASQARLQTDEHLEEIPGDADCVFNPLPLSGKIYHEDSGTWRKVPPLSGAPIIDLPELNISVPVQSEPNSLSSERVQARFDELGRIAELIIDGEPVPFTGPAGELVMYPDYPHAFDAWEVDRHVLSNPLPVHSEPVVASEISGDRHKGSVSFSRKVGKSSTITTRYQLEAADGLLRIEYDIDWKETRCLLKVVFPTDYRGRQARYGAPFGSTLRVQQPSRPDAEAQFENPFSRWLEVGDDAGDQGFFVVSEAKYGATVFNGSAQVSLLRSAFVTTPHMDRPDKALANPLNYSDLKQHKVRIAIGLFNPGTPREERAPALADSLFTDLVPYSGNAVRCSYSGIDGLATLFPCWAKPSERSDAAWILRCHETHGNRGTIRIKPDPGYRIKAVDLMERELPVQPDDDNNYPVQPYALVSFLFEKQG